MSFSPDHQARKRRRVDNSASTLSKPFKSPLIKRQPIKQTGVSDQHLPTQASESPNVQYATISTSQESSTISHVPKPVSCPIYPQSSPLSSSYPRSRLIDTSSDATVITLQKQHSALLLRLSKLKQQLDTAEQALKVTESKQDKELQALVTRWRETSREAAEEVFRGAKERINRMGGVGAWRERSKRKPNGWDDVEIDHSMTKEQQQQIEIQKEEMAEDAEKYGLNDREEELEDEDETFSMDMMLKSMNIEVDIIGYDKDNQRWMD